MIPVGIVFLLLIAAVCLQSIVEAQSMRRGYRPSKDDRRENWNWPNRDAQ